jgi:predicted ABC-type ATPase
MAERQARRSLARTQRVDRPVAYLTGGQPGSGKSYIVEAIAERVADDGGLFVVDPDQIRPLLPYMEPYLANAILETPEVADRDAGMIAYELIQIAKVNGRNILVDGTLQNTARAKTLALELKEAGYIVELHGMAIYPDLGHARTYTRREADIMASPTGFGRGVSDEFHDQAVEGFSKTVQAYYEEKLVNRIALYGIGQKLLDIKLVDDAWGQPVIEPFADDPVSVLDEEHENPTKEILVDTAMQWSKVSISLGERNAPATEQEKIRLFRVRAIAALPKLPRQNARSDTEYIGIILKAGDTTLTQSVDDSIVIHDLRALVRPPVLRIGQKVIIRYIGMAAIVEPSL